MIFHPMREIVIRRRSLYQGMTELYLITGIPPRVSSRVAPWIFRLLLTEWLSLGAEFVALLDKLSVDSDGDDASDFGPEVLFLA